MQGLEGNPTAAAFGLLYGDLGGYDRACSLARQRSNLSLLAADAAIVGTHEALWEPLPDTAESDGADEDEPAARPPRFAIGDFAAFGIMLGEMIGERPGTIADGG